MNARAGNGNDNGDATEFRNASDLERQGDQYRENMDRTLDQIEHELSPGRLMDRSTEFVRTHGADFMREAGNIVRENPIPVLLTAIGAAWLAVSMAKSGAGSRSRSGAEGAHLDEDMESFEDFADGQGYAQGQGVAQGRAQELRSRAAELPRKAGTQLANLVREQPVALGALALAVGALLGAAMPTSEYENRLFGESRKRITSDAQRSDPAVTDESLTDE